MGLREQAQLDARAILEDTSGFAWPITLTSPLGVVTSLKGFTTDVGQTIDPETGQAVAGRRASAVLSLSSLPAMPEAVAERNRKPWLARFADSTGAVASWKVVEVLPDRAAGVVVLILESFQQAIVVLTGRLTLPSLRLTGSVAPTVRALGGALVLPSLRLAGSVAPTVRALGGALALPSLRLAGSVAPTVALSGALVLPSLRLAGSVAPTVALSGALVLPSLRLAGSVAPTVRALGGALVLPSLHLAGSVAPKVALSGALVLPSLRLAGTLSWFTLRGTLVLPSLHLAGSISPTVTALSGSLVLPSLHLTGSVAPKVTIAGALALPLVQLSGSYTTGALSMSSWLRVVNATLVSGDVSSLPDFLNANPAVQTVAGRRPTLENSANGLPCMRFGSGDVLSWPIIAANSNNVTWGVGLWIKPDSLAGIAMLISDFPLTGGASGFRLRWYTQTNGLTCEVYASSSDGRFGHTTAAALTTGWQFATLEYDAGGGTEAAKLTMTVGGTVRSLTFGNQGIGAAIGNLVSVTGNHLFGDDVDNGTPQFPYAGLYGPNIYQYGAKMSGATQGLLTTAARAAYMNYQVPT